MWTQKLSKLDDSKIFNFKKREQGSKLKNYRNNLEIRKKLEPEWTLFKDGAKDL